MAEQQASMRAAFVLAEVGIRPADATDAEIELAERLLQRHRYIEGAADEMRKVLRGPPQS